MNDHTTYSQRAADEGRAMNSDEQRADRFERLARIVHMHQPRPFYCGECEVTHRDSTDCRA